MTNHEIKDEIVDAKTFIKSNRNYIIIALLSIIAVFFLPMLGSNIGLKFIIPDTLAGWVIYLLTKTCIVVINIMIFDQFMKRAKINVQDNEFFKEAENILREYQNEDEEPLPAQFYIDKMYKTKMTTTIIFTVLAVFGFTNAILTFDWVSMLSYIFTIAMALIFGWISMSEAEDIWIEKHYRYAKKIEKERNEKNLELHQTELSE